MDVVLGLVLFMRPSTEDNIFESFLLFFLNLVSAAFCSFLLQETLLGTEFFLWVSRGVTTVLKMEYKWF
jgi:hypothetical protein